jgi:DNA-binding PadR family transcriptional regulator
MKRAASLSHSQVLILKRLKEQYPKSVSSHTLRFLTTAYPHRSAFYRTMNGMEKQQLITGAYVPGHLRVYRITYLGIAALESVTPRTAAAIV